MSFVFCLWMKLWNLFSNIPIQLTNDQFVTATAKFPQERFPQTEEKGPGGLQQPQQPTGPKKVVLNSSDELFDDIRDLNFSAVGIHLSRRAKQISAAFEVSVSFSFSPVKMFWSSRQDSRSYCSRQQMPAPLVCYTAPNEVQCGACGKKLT